MENFFHCLTIVSIVVSSIIRWNMALSFYISVPPLHMLIIKKTIIMAKIWKKKWNSDNLLFNSQSCLQHKIQPIKTYQSLFIYRFYLFIRNIKIQGHFSMFITVLVLNFKMFLSVLNLLLFIFSKPILITPKKWHFELFKPR